MILLPQGTSDVVATLMVTITKEYLFFLSLVSEVAYNWTSDTTQGGEWPKILVPFLYALTLSNTIRFSKLFHCQNQDKNCSNTMAKDPTNVPHLKCVATLRV